MRISSSRRRRLSGLLQLVRDNLTNRSLDRRVDEYVEWSVGAVGWDKLAPTNDPYAKGIAASAGPPESSALHGATALAEDVRSDRKSHARACHTLRAHQVEHAIAVALPWISLWTTQGYSQPLEYLRTNSPCGVAAVLNIARALASKLAVDELADCRQANLCEELLAADSGSDRRRRGVYYTPPEIVRFIVRSIDQALCDDFHFADGLAHADREDCKAEGVAGVLRSKTRNCRGLLRKPPATQEQCNPSAHADNDASTRLPAVRILDPAAGSGVFLSEAVGTIHRRLAAKWLAEGCDEPEIASRWNDYVPRHLLPRLAGWEIMPAAVVAAHCLLASALLATGYCFRDPTPLGLELRDALAPPSGDPFTVVLGNPPYASLSTAAHGWIESLIQSPRGGYMTVNGQPLGEKKHWLHDDYVKFLRLAQWHVEQSGYGVVGMVTNHGYLENASFRGMRCSLARTFPHINAVDLHGNAKMHERSPDGSRDENVFGIASGVAIGLFSRPPQPATPRIGWSDLWGPRASKLARLSGADIPVCQSHTSFISGRRGRLSHVEYMRAWRLCDAMPLNTTAPVTARDSFLLAFTRDELIERVEAFCDLGIDDDAIRRRFFGRTRSSKYPPGDSRGWKLAEARRVLADDPAWRDRIVLCQYRPLDYRYVLWHEAMVDWPRTQVVRHLLDHPNLALIARRQSPRSLPANFFWATRTLALDGIVRSDNRGSESLFPLWRFDEQGTPHANFAPEFVADMERATGLAFVAEGWPVFCEAKPGIAGVCCANRQLPKNNPILLTPLALAGYIYGLFWSSGYRERYHDELTSDFPRILPPHDAAHFQQTSHRGLALLNLHTQLPALDDRKHAAGPSIASGYPQWRDGRVWIDPTTAIAQMSEEAWNLRIGAHQVARKWLRDRRGRGVTTADQNWYELLATMCSESVSTAGSRYFPVLQQSGA